MGKHRFDSQIVASDHGPSWCYIRVPAEVSKALGTRGRVSVRLTAGKTVFRTSVFPDGKGGHHAMFNKAMRDAAGAAAGDTVPLALEPDTEERKVALPADLKKALAAAPREKAFFDGLSPSCRQEYAGYVEEAKRPGTRLKRIATTLSLLKKGQRRVKM